MKHTPEKFNIRLHDYDWPDLSYSMTRLCEKFNIDTMTQNILRRHLINTPEKLINLYNGGKTWPRLRNLGIKNLQRLERAKDHCLKIIEKELT